MISQLKKRRKKWWKRHILENSTLSIQTKSTYDFSFPQITNNPLTRYILVYLFRNNLVDFYAFFFQVVYSILHLGRNSYNMSVEYWSTAVQLYKAFLSIRSFQGNEVFASIRTFFCKTKLVWYSEKYFSPGFFSFFLVISTSTCHRFQIISVTRLSVKCSRNKPIVRWNLKWIWLNHTDDNILDKKNSENFRGWIQLPG